MPHVALEVIPPGRLLASAAARWETILASRPDLEPAVVLQRRLLAEVIALAGAIERGKLPRLSLPPKYLAGKLAKGVPALAREPIPVPTAVLKPAFLRLCAELSRGGAGDAADHIGSLISEGRLDAAALFAASLARDQDAIRTGAVHQGVAPDLLWLAGELTVSPFVHALQQALFGSGDPALQETLRAWNHGYCPLCGSWPALAEVVASHRVLRCSFCALAWELNQYSCIYCGEEGEGFVTAAPDEERKDRRVEICKACGGYLKTVDAPALSPFPLLAIADLETMDLDVAAMEQGYGRPPMKDFTARR